MSGEKNPSPLAGEATESRGAETAVLDFAPDELRAIDLGRRALSALLVVAAASLLATLTMGALLAVGGLPPDGIVVFAVCGVVFVLAQFGLFLAGLQLTPHLHRRLGALQTLGLLVPFANVPIALAIVKDARRTLADRGVRPGWLSSDFSHAAPVPREET